jgi:hypothetical protein
MKHQSRSLLSALLLAASTALPSLPLPAADAAKPSDSAKKAPAEPTGQLVALTPKDAEWAAEARKTYPLTVCLTSDEPLGSMGESPEYIYRVEGKPDRLVVFCCDGCNEDFLKDPAPYLAKLDAAKTAKKKESGKKADGHKGHH